MPGLAVSHDAVGVVTEAVVSICAISGRESKNDDRHVETIDAAQRADYLPAWNYRHINNAERKSAIAAVVESLLSNCVQRQLLARRSYSGGDSND